MTDRTVCGTCGIPLSWPNIYGCDQEHGEMTRDDLKLINRFEIAEMYELSYSRIGQFAIGHHMYRKTLPFPEPTRWKRSRAGTGWSPLYRIIDIKAWGFRNGYYAED